jgi:hypothetical protein
MSTSRARRARPGEHNTRARRRRKHRGSILLACALGFACALSPALAVSMMGDAPEELKELAEPATVRNVQSGRDGEWVTLEATTRGETYKAALYRKDNLAPDAGARSNDNSDVLTREEMDSFRRCSYSGEALDDEGNSWVAYGTLCQGKLRLIVQTHADPLTIRGDIWGEAKTPQPRSSSTSRRMLGIEEIDVAEEAQAESWHLSDEFTALRKNETYDGVERSKFAVPVTNETAYRQSRKLLVARQNPKKVELLFWAASDRMSALNGNKLLFIEETILQVQYMQAAFDKTSGFNRPVELIIKHFLFTTTSDPWGYTSFSNLLTFLNRGATWLQNERQNPSDLVDPATGQIYQFDALMALTTRSGSGAVGYARVGSVCNDDAFNVNAVVSGGVLYAGTLMAHEFGHTLGFMHDGQSIYGTGACDVSGDIMDPIIDGPEETYSQCSIEQYNSGTYRDGSLYSVNHACLEDGETRNFCGNGIREEGEDCDCLNNNCGSSDPGCNALTCRYAPGKTCSVIHDTCCNGQGNGAASAGTVCRAAVGPCDVQETCDGTSVSCPTDVIKPLGEKCEDAQGDVGACYNGECANRDRECRLVFGEVYRGGKWCSQSCYDSNAQVRANFDFWSPGNPFNTFQAEDCTQKLWCAQSYTHCQVGGSVPINFFDRMVTRRDGFPCSTAVGNSFPKMCISGVCTHTSSVVVPPRYSPGPTPPSPPLPPVLNPSPSPPPPPPAANPAPSPPPPSPSPPPPSPSPPPTPGFPPTPTDQKFSPPPRIADGGDVSDSGMVRYIKGKVTLNGYTASEMNIANKNALATGLASYTQITSGTAGVTILDVGDARRRRLLSNHAVAVSFQLLLTDQDSTATLLNALDTSSASTAGIMLNTLQARLPQLTSVSVTRVTLTEEAVDENFNRDEEDVKEYGGGLLAASITIVIVVPILSLIVGLYLGPTYRFGLATMVLFGENNYEKMRKRLFPKRYESEHAKHGFFRNFIPGRR